MKPIVRVTWNDAADHPEPWVHEEDLKKFADSPAAVVSVGYLIKKDRHYITIAGDYQPDLNIWGRVTKIPKKMVTKIEEIPLPNPESCNGADVSPHEKPSTA